MNAGETITIKNYNNELFNVTGTIRVARKTFSGIFLTIKLDTPYINSTGTMTFTVTAIFNSTVFNNGINIVQ